MPGSFKSKIVLILLVLGEVVALAWGLFEMGLLILTQSSQITRTNKTHVDLMQMLSLLVQGPWNDRRSLAQASAEGRTCT